MAKQEDKREFGVSTEPGENYMDKVQASVQETGKGPNGESQDLQRSDVNQDKDNKDDEVKVDRSVVEFIDPEPQESKQVESTTVIFVPHKDFEARVNQQVMHFRTDVPTEVTRDVANMLVEDRERGYIK